MYMGKDLTEARSSQSNLFWTVDLGKYRRNSTVRNSIAMATISIVAEASVTEEPREGKLHARICAGGAGRPAFLP